MRFDTPGIVGARGGHGPVRYTIESIEPGRAIVFRFTGPRGFEGIHTLSLSEAGPDACLIRHVIDMRLQGPALLSWPLVFRPLHDALLEDALDRAESYCGGNPRRAHWSPYVRVLMFAARKAMGQAGLKSARR